MNSDIQKQFMYLFERVGEPLYFGPRGNGTNLTFYNVPMQTCAEVQHASTVMKQGFSNVQSSQIQVERPSSMPDLSKIGQACPKSTLYCFFNPSHQRAVRELRKIMLDQRDVKTLLNMACACRDNDMINPKVWITAFASCLINRPDTKGFRMPALWEVMPDAFFSPFCLKQATRQGSIPQQDRAIIEVSITATGRDTNIENRLAYFREDLGINSCHWHWHLIYTLDAPAGRRDRKGELFYWFHHEMISRYDAERLANGLNRVRSLRPDDPVIKEGYFPKLTDTNSGRVWGTRQQDTKLADVNREDDMGLPDGTRVIKLETFRQYRDRIMDAIDKMSYLAPNGQRMPLNIDILGDIVESSSLNPNSQYYGTWGFHNLGHLLIALSHDPEFKHRENMGVMGDNTAVMRDPAFYRWHKYIDELFNLYKQTMQPYNPTGGELQLVWDGVQVQNITVQSEGNPAPQPNIMRTFQMKSSVDLSRGLDFLRFGETLGPVFARVTHLNHDPFNYTITVQNGGAPRPATVRIFMAPRLNEHRERFPMVQQRLLFFELDRFTVQLTAGSNTIRRRSTQSTVTIPWDQNFRDLERSVEIPTPEQSVCGCGWPEHLLIPRGNATGQLYDLVVFVTNGQDDLVVQPRPAPNRGDNCRDAMSYCGILDQLYPDKKPMGYPFDRNPFTVPSPNDRSIQVPVPNLDEYVARIPNMRTTQVRIVYDPNRMEMRNDGVASTMRVINGDPLMPSKVECPMSGSRPARPGSPSGPSTSTSAASAAVKVPVSASGKSRPGIPPPPSNRGPKQWGSSPATPKVTTKVTSRVWKPKVPGWGGSPPNQQSSWGNWGWRG